MPVRPHALRSKAPPPDVSLILAFVGTTIWHALASSGAIREPHISGLISYLSARKSVFPSRITRVYVTFLAMSLGRNFLLSSSWLGAYGVIGAFGLTDGVPLPKHSCLLWKFITSVCCVRAYVRSSCEAAGLGERGLRLVVARLSTPPCRHQLGPDHSGMLLSFRVSASIDAVRSSGVTLTGSTWPTSGSLAPLSLLSVDVPNVFQNIS